MLRKLLLLGLVSYALNKAFSSPDQRSHRPGRPARRAAGSGVRQAGRREMKDPPRSWDLTDERLDESFPASDPPGTY